MKNQIIGFTLTGILFFIGLMPAMAQGKYGATAEDSIKCIENLSVYKDFLRENKYEKAFSFVRKVYQICPQSSLKLYVDAEKIIGNMIKENKGDKERKNGLIDTLYLLYDARIQHFGKEGYVLGKKGAAMLKYGRPSYQEAYNTLKKSITLEGNASEAYVIDFYFRAALKLNEETAQTADFWVDMFNECSSIIDYNIATSTKPRDIESYTTAKENVLKMVEPYISCEVLTKFYESKYEGNKDNQKWLASAAEIMDSKDCAGSPIFFKVASRLHAMNPSTGSARNMGIMSMKKSQYGEAVGYFVEAIDLADDMTDDENLSKTLADLELWLSKAHFGQKNYPAARTHAQKAAGYREGWGEPYMLIGDLYASSISQCSEGKDGALKSPYWVAVDMYAKAKSVDAEYAVEAAQKIAKYSQYFPSTQDAFFHGVTDGSEYTVGCWINVNTKARLK
ncbi:MAG: hypothetical protein RIC15_06660 [Vicingaceae bacterium]